jgi:hypothetical protein
MKRGRLYRGASGRRTRRRIIRYYEQRGESPARARRSYGAIVGKVRRERQGWHRPHRHGFGEHPGPCSKACRAGLVAHPSYGRRRRR